MFKVFRPNGDKTAAVGEDFEFVRMVDPTAIADATQIDYATMLRPDPAKVAAFMESIGETAGAGSSEGATAKVAY